MPEVDAAAASAAAAIVAIASVVSGVLLFSVLLMQKCVCRRPLISPYKSSVMSFCEF